MFDLFASPSGAVVAKSPSNGNRASILGKIKKGVEGSAFLGKLAALSLAMSEGVTAAEAREYGFADGVSSLADSEQQSMPLRVAATKLLRQWVKRKRADSAAGRQPSSRRVAE